MSTAEDIPTIDAVIGDPASSHWLKSSVQSALTRDPVDSLNDALLLAALLDQRVRDVLGLESVD